MTRDATRGVGPAYSRTRATWTFVCAIALGLIPALAAQAQTVEIYAGGGIGDGLPAAAQSLEIPRAVTKDASGNIYVSEFNRIRKITPDGLIHTHAILTSGATSMAVDVNGDVLFTGSVDFIGRVTKNGVERIAGLNAGSGGFGGDGGDAMAASFNQPRGIAVDAQGNIYIADTLNHRVRKIDTDGIVTTVAGSGPAVWNAGMYAGDGGPAVEARLNRPEGVVVSPAGTVLVNDSANHRVREIGADGIIRTVVGNGLGGWSGDGGPAISAGIAYPIDAQFDAVGNLYIVERDNKRIRKVSATGIISTLAGCGNLNPPTCAWDEYGLSKTAMVPVALIVNGVNDVTIADFEMYRLRRISSGHYTTVAGNATTGTSSSYAYSHFSGDGGAASNAQLNVPGGLAMDASGALYVADTGNYRIRKIAPNGTISTIAGNGVSAFSGDGGPAILAQFTRPTSLAFDSQGNLYVDDSYRIRKITPNGMISTIAGTGSSAFGGDGGPAVLAKLGGLGIGSVLRGLAIDVAGNIYLPGPNSVRKISSDGIIRTIAGTGTAGFSGDGGPAKTAEFSAPGALSSDGYNLYITDYSNGRIRKINQAGIVTTLAGSGANYCPGASSDCGIDRGGLATSAVLSYPQGAIVDPAGSLYILRDGLAKVNHSGIIGRFAEGVTGQAMIAGPDGAIYVMYSNPYVTTSDGSLILKITQPWPSSTRPQPPTDVGFDSTGLLAFRPPVLNGGSPITGYTVSSIPAGAIDLDAGTLGSLAYLPGIAFSRGHRITGLVDGVTYVFTVRATNEVGDSDESAPSKPFIPGPKIYVLDTRDGEQDTSYFALRVQLDRQLTHDVTFDLSTANGTAMAGSDYEALDRVGVVIPAGQGSVFVYARVYEDEEVEADETFTINMSNVVGATPLRSQGLATIVNDDSAQLSIADATVQEGDNGVKTATFVVTLAKPMPTPIRFRVATSDGTATAGSDYVSRNQQERVMDAGRTRALFEVTINGDLLVEGDETFTATLISIDTTVADGTAVGTILDDDSNSVESAHEPGSAAVRASIAQIQGGGAVSSLAGGTVETNGIVTALTTDGFVIQTPDSASDGDSSTAEGLFVLSADGTVEVGDALQVLGVVREAQIGEDPNQLTLTQLVASKITLVERRQPLPKVIVLDVKNAGVEQSVNGLERFEGMRVSIPTLVAVSPTGVTIDKPDNSVRSNGRFYGVVEGVPRPFREPGLSVLDRARGPAGVSPPLFDGNPERLLVNSLGQRNGRALSVDSGDRISGLIGVLGYGDGSFQVLPDATATLSVQLGANPRAASVASKSQATIGSINFSGFSDDGQTGKGSESASSAYATWLAKAANVICASARSPDILRVAGVEGALTVSDLVAAVNENDGNLLFPGNCEGSPGYRAYDPGRSRVNAGARTVFLVRSAQVKADLPRVEVLSAVALGAGAVFRNRDGSSELLHDSAPLLLRARIHSASAASEEVTVLSAQLSALRDRLATAGPHGWTTRGDYLRAKRAAQALSLARLIASRQRSYPQEKLVVLGNFEANEFSDGQADLMGVLTGHAAAQNRVLNYLPSPISRPLENLTTTLAAAERYDATRDGNAQMLGHVLVNRQLKARYPELHLELVRVNADFGEDNAADPGVPLRTAEFDPQVLYLERR